MRLVCLALCLPLFAATASGQDDGDDELRPGLLAEYRVGDEALRRVDETVAFVWSDAAPDPLLPSGLFTANWSGQLLIREAATYRLHAYVAGDVRVSVNGKTVLIGEADNPRWISGPDTPLDFGLQELEVDYQTSTAPARIHLYWSSDRFPLEPLPEASIFQPDGDAASAAASDVALRERGRRQFAALRCGACHRDAAPVAPEPAPSLAHIGVGTDRAWLLAKLQHRHPAADGSRMPAFGLDENDAEALLAYLTSQAQPLELPPVPEVKKKSKRKPPDGNVLLHSLGCLACHRVGELGTDAPFDGGDLSSVGARRSREWLHAQLREPERVNAHARMPVFELTDAERVALVETLAKLNPGDDQASSQADAGTDNPQLIAVGRRLFESLQCAACHASDDNNARTPQAPRLTRRIADWEQTCLSELPDPQGRRPSYPQADRGALRSYVTAIITRGGSVSPPGAVERGRLVIEQRNCLGCHERGANRGIVTTAGRVAAELNDINGQSQALIPPNLTATGDKFLDEPLAKSVRGEQKRRMPWLRVRMPKFKHSNTDQSAIVAYFRETDRVPDAAPESRVIPDTADAQMLLAGRTLAGPHGFSCIACHECGDYAPPNVAVATHGSDLLGMARRMRPEFFLRWTRSPLRVVPGIEMPSYERPAPGVLDGNPHTQLAALWHALQEPDFTVPTNPAAVEQLLAVRPGERTRIIRDVFSVAEVNGGGYVARALAIGFDNGLSVLFDIDKARVREWTLGEFARQRTQGKSWFWDMAGAPLLKSKRTGYGLWLELPDHDPRFIEPSISNNEPRGLSPWPSADTRPIRLKSYNQTEEAVHVEYAVDFATSTGPVSVTVTEKWRTSDSPESQQIVRVIRVPKLETGRLLFTIPAADELTEFTSAVATTTERVQLPNGQWAIPVLNSTLLDDDTLTLEYTTRLNQAPLRPIEIADPPATTEPIRTAPGFAGARLPITTAIMPTGMAWRPDGTLVFTSLKGHVYLAHDTDGDGLEDKLTVFEEGLAAPFGVLADGDDLLVAHKAELLRLRDADGDGHCDDRIVVADGWGYTHDYHDWMAGPVRDNDGNLFLAISSDYSQKQRDPADMKWRGKVLRLGSNGTLAPFAHELRYPMGIAFDPAGRLFVSDQQGVQNSFNEINHLVEDGRYGVPAKADPPGSEDHTRASVQIPHPWTRSVNGITFLPSSPRTAVRGTPDSENATPLDVFAGHGIGCEYNGRFLVRFSFQEVNGALQGAVYEFTSPKWENDSDAFLGPISAVVSPDGALYVGSIFDSGWLGGRNTGEIVKLSPQSEIPNGIREVRAVAGGFDIEFIRPVDRDLATDPANYTLSGYTRIWQGSYATPDSDRHSPAITGIEVDDDVHTVALQLDDLRARHVYEIDCRPLTSDGAELRPSGATYSLNRLP